jgi:transcriptional regulator with XRE-family HTH domain
MRPTSAYAQMHHSHGDRKIRRMDLPTLLRHTREVQRLTQLELSLRLRVSQRHVSFLETGRSRPSKGMLLSWLDAVNASPSLRKAAMLHAGFAMADRAVAVNGSAPLAPEISQILAAYGATPALAFNSEWQLLDLNESAQRLFQYLMPERAEKVQSSALARDMIHAVADPEGLLYRMKNARDVSATFLHRVETESWSSPAIKPRVALLAESLSRTFGRIDAVPAQQPPASTVNLVFDSAHGELKFLMTQSTLGSPQDISMASVRLELWLPSDEHTRRVLQSGALFGSEASTRWAAQKRRA